MKWLKMLLVAVLAGSFVLYAGCDKDKPESRLGKEAKPGEVLGEVLMNGKWELVYNSGSFTMSCKALSFDSATGTISGDCQCVAGCLQGGELKRLSYTCTYEKDGNKLGCACIPTCESAQNQEPAPEPQKETSPEISSEPSSEQSAEPASEKAEVSSEPVKEEVVSNEEAPVSQEPTPEVSNETTQETTSEPVAEATPETTSEPATDTKEPATETTTEPVSEPSQETSETSAEPVKETTEPSAETSQEVSTELKLEVVSEEKTSSEIPKEEVLVVKEEATVADGGQEEKTAETSTEMVPVTCAAGQTKMDNKCACSQLSQQSNFGPYRCGNVLSWKGGAVSPYTGNLTWGEVSHVLCAVPDPQKKGLIINAPYVRNNPTTGILELNPVEADVVQNAGQEFVRTFTIPSTNCTLQSLMFKKGTLPSVNDFCWPCHQYFTTAARNLFGFRDHSANCSIWFTDQANVNTCP